MEFNNLTLKPDDPKDRPSFVFDNIYRTYKDGQNPEALFGKALRYLSSLRHVRTFEYIMDRFWVHGEDLTEDLIKKTHGILCKGVSIIDPGAEYPDVPYAKYAGHYRGVPVGAGNTMFVMPQYVPPKMAEMCANLKNDNGGKEFLDPFSLAAKYSLRFVEIHPFQDGNG
ncbi:fido domain-containing protein [Fusarium sp. MPI-SDFR-AT-0072]|nr:fido domain-containing protein [Fusarium sp. MPI-SDFR-AT-0072]